MSLFRRWIAAGPRKLSFGTGAQTLAAGVICLAILTLFQRFIGLGRSVVLCRWLPTDQLGQWDLAFTFLLTMGPLVVLGIPGALGRFAESYRKKNQLRRFIQITSLSCLVIFAGAAAVLFVMRRQLGQWLLNAPPDSHWIAWLIPTLVAVVLFNYVTSLMTALRQHRAFAGVQAVHGIAFAVLCLILVPAFSYRAAGVVVAYAVACLIGAALALLVLRSSVDQWEADAEDSDPDSVEDDRFSSHLVSAVKWILPFALAVWLSTLIANSFKMSDRMLMVHLSGNDQLAMYFVGQYHAARIIPRLLTQFAMSLTAMLTPHLVQDWDRGEIQNAVDRLGGLLKFVSVTFCVVGVLVLAFAPLLFSVVMDGKFGLAVELLPWSLAAGITFSLAFVAQNALWCSKKAWRTSLCFLAGLVVNVLAGVLLFPKYGILGIAIGTFVATAAALGVMLWLAARVGFRFSTATYVLAALPAALVSGYLTAALFLLVIIVATLFFDEFVTEAERAKVRQMAGGRLQKLLPSSST